MILLKRYRLGASPPACDDAAASASRSFRSSRTTAASAVGLTCERASVAARASHICNKDGGTHALVAEAREDLERRTPEIRVEEVGHLLHGCVGVCVNG